MPPYMRNDPPSAGWMPPTELQSPEFTMQNGKILIGRTNDGREIGIDDNRHIGTFAGSRAGKTATSLITNLFRWSGSTIVIDPKGEIASATAKPRSEMGQDVYILDPFGEVKDETARQFRTTYNPLDELRETHTDDVIDDAAMIAEAFITNNGDRQDHWTMSAKNLVRGLSLFDHVRDADKATLTNVRKMLTLPFETDNDDDESLSDHLTDMTDIDDYDGVISSAAWTMASKPENERGSIISSATEETSFLDSPPMRAHLKSGGLSTLRVLKRKPTTIYLVLPASRMATHFRWLRLVLMQAMAAMEREENKTGKPILFVLEEMFALGHMAILEKAAGLMAGYDVKLWFVFQDLSQIKTLYPSSWETFIGNAGILEAFGNTDMTTLEYLSKRLGNSMAVQRQPEMSSPEHKQRGDPTFRDTVVNAPLMAAHEISLAFSREKQNKLVMLAGRKPFAVGRIYWKEMING